MDAYATPLLQNPHDFGADISVFSATKHIDGQGRCLGGAVLGSRVFCQETLKPFMRNTGAAMSPFNAWVLLKGLETLNLRIEKASRVALSLAQMLEQHPKVEQVHYPHLHRKCIMR